MNKTSWQAADSYLWQVSFSKGSLVAIDDTKRKYNIEGMLWCIECCMGRNGKEIFKYVQKTVAANHQFSVV